MDKRQLSGIADKRIVFVEKMVFPGNGPIQTGLLVFKKKALGSE